MAHAVHGLQRNKLSGAKLVKYTSDQLHHVVHQHMSKVWDNESMSNYWQRSIICPATHKAIREESRS